MAGTALVGATSRGPRMTAQENFFDYEGLSSQSSTQPPWRGCRCCRRFSARWASESAAMVHLVHRHEGWRNQGVISSAVPGSEAH
jgi:hypothetical protein